MGCCATKSSSRETLEFADKSSCCEKLVFADKNYDFRIPALLYVKEWNTFLAFAEKRTSAKDADATNLVMSKGTRDSGSLKVPRGTPTPHICVLILFPCHVYTPYL